MIGYTMLVFISFVVLVIGFIIVGVAVRGWREEAKQKQDGNVSQTANSQIETVN